MPGVIRLLAEELTGGDVGKFFKQMELGQFKSVEVLPKLFERMGKEAAKGWEQYTKSTRFQQGRASVGFENQLMLFGQSGGDQAFFRIWKSFSDTLPQTDNLVRALATGFNALGRGVEGVGSIIVMLDDGLEKFNKLNPEVQQGLITLGAAFALLGTKIGRAFLPLTAAYLVLEDIASYRQGKKSITGLAMGEDYSGLSGKNPALGARLDLFERITGKSTEQRVSDYTSFEFYKKAFNTSPMLGLGRLAQAPGVFLGAGMTKASEGLGYLLGDRQSGVKLTPGNSIDSMINNLAYGGGDSTMSARGIGKTFYVDTVNLYPNNNTPEEFDYLLNRTTTFNPVGE